MRSSRLSARTLVIACGVLLALVGCTPTSRPLPTPAADSPERAAAELADGLSTSDLSQVEFIGATSAAVNSQFRGIVAGMGAVRPDVGVSSLNAQSDVATVTLRFTWTFPGVPSSWVYDTTATLHRDEGRWKTDWLPAMVLPELDGFNRLSQRRLQPTRGLLLGADGATIMKPRPVVRIGIDKSAVATDEQERSARRLAALVKITGDTYAAKVKDAGSQAFVEAIVYRANDTDRPGSVALRAIPGALAVEDQLVLAPTRDFARGLIGTVGEATKEIVDASRGTIVAGDQVGLSGLQRRYDIQFRGTPGVRVQLLDAPNGVGPSPAPSPSPTPRPTRQPETKFEVQPVAGTDLHISLDVSLQRQAESILDGVKPASAIVALRPSTGEVLVVANGAGADGQSIGTVGQYPPGSTFKVASTLALLRAGLTPETVVSCPASVTVDGRKYVNYDDYPTSRQGDISLTTALAQSCNTAFIGQRDEIDESALSGAAASLGLGNDYDVGFPAYFGAVPEDGTPTARAEAIIGQGKVLASPLTMAAVVASVQAGRTVIPSLVEGRTATPSADPLTADEATKLRALMRAVVTQGTGSLLRGEPGPAVIAKTGTAEYGKAPVRTHAWMIAAQGDLAVAVFVADGSSGSHTAGPLLKRFLAAAR